ncbi:amino acid ABC transporter ATPase [Verrucomicrobia bacterium IMCC26134]|jgi:branched-chain amino acid transport system ATP-binding protein|nr:amino acid ABC transporter ATPase [Verrucomicrobia bacterium IMCC26134]
MLTVTDLHVSYGAINALSGISFNVPAGAIVTLIGGNGAGKTTTLHTLSGLLRPTCGRITFDGRDLTNVPPHDIVGRGLCQVPEGRLVFPELTVLANLDLGAYLRSDRAAIAATRDHVFQLFPRLAERRSQTAGTLSGGEQQMLAIGRALMSAPKFLLLDEPSLGLAPKLIESIFERIVAINRDEGIPILLVEQNARLALAVSSYAYVLESGRIALHGPSAELADDPRLKAAYLGG